MQKTAPCTPTSFEVLKVIPTYSYINNYTV